MEYIFLDIGDTDWVRRSNANAKINSSNVIPISKRCKIIFSHVFKYDDDTSEGLETISNVQTGGNNDNADSAESTGFEIDNSLIDDNILSEFLQRNIRFIRRSSIVYPQYRIENYPMNNLSTHSLSHVLHDISKYIPFSLVAELGFVLRHKITNDLRFFYPGIQTLIFNGPVKINSMNCIKKLLNRHNENQIYENLINSFSDSLWVLVRVANMRCFITIAHLI